MFASLTFTEWDALCSMMERALAYDVPRAWGTDSYERFDLMDDLLTVHGLLMMRPTQPNGDQS